MQSEWEESCQGISHQEPGDVLMWAGVPIAGMFRRPLWGGINPQGGEPWQPRGSSSESLTGGTSRTPPPLRRCLPIQQCQLITRRTELWWTDDMPCIKYPGLAWAASQRDATDLPSSRSCHRHLLFRHLREPESLPLTAMPRPPAGTELLLLCSHRLVSPLSCSVLFIHINTYTHTHMYTCVCVYSMYMHVCVYIFGGGIIWDPRLPHW